MKKYRFNKLDIEITRKCNRRCEHCMRGDAQDLSMSTEVIDRIFEDVRDVKHIVFGNGEPLLEVKKIVYFIDALAESRWTTQVVEVTTNGILHEAQIIDAFEKFCASGNNRRAYLRISNDEYHSTTEYEHAYAFYKPLADAANKRIRKRYNSLIDVHYTLEEGIRKNDQLPGLIYSGRAVDLVDQNKEGLIFGKNVELPFCYMHRIKIIGEDIPCYLQISANGNVCFHELAGYNELDDLAIGNIMECRMTDIIDLHNARCTVLCSEAELLYRKDYLNCMLNISHAEKDFAYILTRIWKGILDLRCHARKKYPHVPAQRIIEGLPFPNTKETHALIQAMYEQSPYYTENLISNIKKYKFTARERLYHGAMYTAVAMYLKDRTIERKYPYWLFGTSEDTKDYLAGNFEDLDTYYEINPEEADNGKIFPCEPDDYKVIYYSEESPHDIWTEYADATTKGYAMNILTDVFREFGMEGPLSY